MKAWETYSPSAENPWDLRKVGHLYRRAGFGASFAELEQGLKDGPMRTVDRLLEPQARDADFENTSEFMASERSLPAGSQGIQLAAWWLFRMLRSPRPLQEKLTLFWHNHFATSLVKVQNARFMLGQYRILNQHALGSFRDMVHAITTDPAMLIWLDTKDSKKGKPNENYARELMELFTLGIGHYTETDIREAAKAFTGYEIKNGKTEFQASDHDDSSKKVLGRKGNFTARDIVEICLDQPACAQFLVRKLYRFLISEVETPTDDLIAPLVKEYRKSNYDTGKLVGTMLRSHLFFSSKAYRQRVKSPIDFAVGIVRALEGNVGPLPLASAMENLGQVLFAPPSVKGWDGGPDWLNAQTLLFRQNLALALTSTDDVRFGKRCDPAAILQKYDRKSDEQAMNLFLSLFLQNDVPSESRQKLHDYLTGSKSASYPAFWSKADIERHRMRSIAHLTLTLPEFQLD